MLNTKSTTSDSKHKYLKNVYFQFLNNEQGYRWFEIIPILMWFLLCTVLNLQREFMYCLRCKYVYVVLNNMFMLSWFLED